MYSNQPTPANQPTPPAWPSTPGAAPAHGRRGGRLRDLLLFRRMLTPGFMAVLWVLGSALIVIGMIVGAYDALTDNELAVYSTLELAGYFIGLIVAGLLMLLLYRVILEIVVVLFRINDRLGEIEQRGRGM